MAPAAVRVFETVELLEMILLQMPAKDVLLKQRVNKIWLLTIADSIKLQRHLFFAPQSGESLRYFNDHYAKTSFPDYLLHHAKPARVATAEDEVRLNPMIGTLYEKMRIRTDGRNLRSQLPLGWRLSDASWRRMLLMQPPVHAVLGVFGMHVAETIPVACECTLIDTEAGRLEGVVEVMDRMYKKINGMRGRHRCRDKYVRIRGEDMWNVEGLDVAEKVLDYSVGMDPL